MTYVPPPICSFCAELRHPLCPDRLADHGPRRCGCDCIWKDPRATWSPGVMYTPSGKHEVWTVYVPRPDGKKDEYIFNLPPDAIAYFKKKIEERDAAKTKPSEGVQ